MEPKIAPETDSARRQWLGAVAPGRDVARFGFSLAVASALSVVQLFVIPKRLDLAEYGHYRVFLVYAAYLGVLHFGLIDGAFVRWAGMRSGVIAREWRQVGRWLITVQGLVVAIAVVAAMLTSQPLVRLYLLAFAACTLCVNTAALSTNALQAAGDFRSAGRVVALAPALFVASVLVFPARTLAPLLSMYIATYGLASLYGAWRVVHMGGGPHLAPTSDGPELGRILNIGVPVLGASLAAVLSQSADRILLTMLAPITSFALYGFASTVTIAANTATVALSRVALSHAARQPTEERANFLGGFYNVIAASYGLALLAEPLFEHLVATHLPAYVDALPIIRALTVGLPFWVATHVVLVPTLQSHGLVRRQLALELTGVAFVFITCGAVLMQRTPLWTVAAAASVAAAITFVVGLAIVRRAVSSVHVQDALRYAASTSMQSAALMIAISAAGSWINQSLIVAALSLLPTLLAGLAARKRGW